MYFHTLFGPHAFSKNTNNVTKIMLPNGLLVYANSQLRAKRDVVIIKHGVMVKASYIIL